MTIREALQDAAKRLNDDDPFRRIRAVKTYAAVLALEEAERFHGEQLLCFAGMFGLSLADVERDIEAVEEARALSADAPRLAELKKQHPLAFGIIME